ncbi:hypothetical protein GOP47_0026165 [Adiantum capillus-veneris]|uniref:Vesicle transport v-SNARE N-terminal domain-containing protein n=1 Tax=Adiantum capillus-veneris TaxID=13818 RepID=A0A9D4Z3W4_ADICA|nr:hypothetical protein GOP47_0025816 [Adiantum capillus-veneris]KAI5059846.1 hypothetical protein GOP47_0026165 [Adiantum capillus-veneris]
MSAIFESYERQYCELSANLTAKCPAIALLTGERRKQNLAELKTGLDEAESLIRRMDLEARSLQPTQKAVLLAKLREYKSDLNNLRRELKKLSSDTQVARDDLLEGGLLDPLKASSEQRDRLLLSTERMNQSGERIKESKRTLLETEELGVSILQDLHQQRQTLLHAQDTLVEVDDNIGKSKKILLSMTRRMSRNKWIMGGLIGALVTIILFVAYVKLSHS